MNEKPAAPGTTDWLGQEATDLPARLRAVVIRWFSGVPLFKPSGHDVVRRLRLDADGPSIHPGYYKLDLLDAADEIERLRKELAHAKA